MKYLRNYKLYESVKDIFKKLPIEESDISNILIDLTDIGYNLTYKSFYLTDRGTTYEQIEGIGDYYPVILISLKKDVKTKDVRNWDGSLYFDDSEEVLESIYHSVSRLRNTLKEHKLYLNIRNINEVYIRIVFDKEKQDDFDYEVAKDIFTNLLNDGINIDGLNGRFDKDDIKTLYTLEEYLTGSNNKSFIIKPILSNDWDVPNIIDPKTLKDFLALRAVKSNSLSNEADINNILIRFVAEFTEKINDKFPVKYTYNGHSTFRIYGKNNQTCYITITMSEEYRSNFDILLSKGSLFKKEKKTQISLISKCMDVIFKPTTNYEYNDY